MGNTNIYDLCGEWNFRLDYNDGGLEEKWFLNELEEKCFTIPGTTTSNNLGDKVAIEKRLSKEGVKSLRQDKKYIGVLWLQKTFTLNEIKSDEAIYLYLERIIFKSSLWIDSQYVGEEDSLSTAHRFDITKFVKSNGTHTVTIRIDNRDVHNIGPYPSAYTEETQTIWNGIVGKVHVEKLPLQNIQNLILGLSNTRELDVRFDLNFGYEEDIKSKVRVEIKDNYESIQVFEDSLVIEKNKRDLQLNFQLSESVKLWDEFDPSLYDFKITIEVFDDVVVFEKLLGFRFLESSGGILRINGVQSFLRGNIDCCIYPLTGHPPMNKEEWERVFRVSKDYGLNHVRFHSWCPPEEAFNAADEIGVYLQVEAPMWLDTWTEFAVGTYKEHYDYFPKEAERIVKAYSWHPSFCFFSNGNELNGDFNLLENMIKGLKVINPHILYTLTTNWDRKINSEDDIFIAQSVDGIGVRGQYFLDKMVEGSILSFEEGVSKRDVPVISHEVGQYVVYPNVEEIEKYTGVLKPTNFEVIKQDLVENDLLKYIKDYVQGSGKLSCSLYKAELEASLKTKNMAGIQLLGLQDFTGQSTATIGILDVFYDSKGIIEPKDFRSFCDSLVPMVNVPKFKFNTEEDFEARVVIANYRKETLREVKVKVSVIKENGDVVLENIFELVELPVGVTEISEVVRGKIFKGLRGRNKCVLKVELIDYDKVNCWDLWVYEDTDVVKFSNYFEEFNSELVEKLERGESVILCPKVDTIKNLGPSTYFPVFWSPVHFASKDPCGIIVDTKNPLFTDYFKTDIYGSYEWKSFLENTVSMNIDELRSFEPLTMLVPNFFNNHKFTNLFEARVGKGKLILCMVDFKAKENDFVEIRYFKKALRDYVESKDFNPSQELDINSLKALFTDVDNEEIERIDVAKNKPAFADSEKSGDFGAIRGNDGNPSTCWVAKNGDEGHYWQVDLECVVSIVGSKVVFNEVANYMYVIHSSLDGENWTLVVNKTGQVVPNQVHLDKYSCEARYLRITYNGLPSGVWAGHQQFSVYTN